MFEKQYLHYHIFIAVFFIVTIFYFVITPIVAVDTDMWYHLNGGRYMFETGSLPDSSFFSFIQPVKKWDNYYWLFQGLIYKVYQYGGYYGIIVYRVVVFSLAMVFTYLLIFSKVSSDDNSPAYLTLMFTLVFLLLIHRHMVVRPHTITYLFIPVYIYILEHKKRLTVFIPVFSILWVNFHGIEYPVVLIILFSYLAEFYYKRIKSKIFFSKEELWVIIPIVISMFCIFFTPHGINLINIPFKTTQYASLYVTEIRHLELKDYLYYNLSPYEFTIMSFFSVIALMALLSFAKSVLTRQFRLSHMLMFAAGVILVLKGLRFINEFAFLALPLIIKHPPFSLVKQQNVKKTAIVLTVLLMALAFLYLRESFLPNAGKYPLANKNLPVGITTFLKHINKGGTLMNHPNYGGYLQWELYPKYSIFMDMETPFLFIDEDLFFVTNAYTDEFVFLNFYSKYKPAFISAPLTITKFKDIISRYPNYKAVFFDDMDVLYVNDRIYPEIATKYALRAIDPYNLLGTDIGKLDTTKKKLLLNELTKLHSIYAGNAIVNQTIAVIYNSQNKFTNALINANTIIQEAPNSPIGYSLSADSLIGLNKYEDALIKIKEGLTWANDDEKASLYKKMWFVLLKLQRDEAAYWALKNAVNIFASDAHYLDIYNMGLLSLKLRNFKEAIELFKFAYIKTPQTDEKTKALIKEKLLSLAAISDN
ncbi:MAG: hypothetical protein L3V56_01440 [Candidatus Magnetoovum sp. WYHC-5]|nr:hypothetical protein [Candidatus Magnetoovum sp. WYHC-5]